MYRKSKNCEGPHDFAFVTDCNWRKAPFYRCKTCCLIVEVEDYKMFIKKELGDSPSTGSTEPQEKQIEFKLPMILEGENTSTGSSKKLYDDFDDCLWDPGLFGMCFG